MSPTLTWWNDRRKNRRPGVSTWQKARHWRMAPLWVLRGRLPPRICTFSSSSWRPSHWGRDTALWTLIACITRTSSLEQVLTETSSLRTPPAILSASLTSIQRSRMIPTDRYIRPILRLPGIGGPRFFDYHFAVLRTVGLADGVSRAHGKVIPDVQFTENIDRKR